MSAAFSDFRDGAIDDLFPFLDLGFSGSLNSALYLSVGIDLLLDLLLVASVEGWGGGIYSLWYLLPSLISCSSCSLVGVLISVGSTSPSSGSSLSSFSGLLGSGVFSALAPG